MKLLMTNKLESGIIDGKKTPVVSEEQERAELLAEAFALFVQLSPEQLIELIGRIT